ncbi:hypothetical protein GCWU000324_02325 [Kingella oralis ATCC 51147]|uniref:Uncharacterized protein n=1 Tax=Kingella oralis ATCC 51147 TaxID=629741 RepID=C4GJV2_9NEIS|nr:hypothetical protein GCWU000324_02325 [Kingella oralis ATCC 51147]
MKVMVFCSLFRGFSHFWAAVGLWGLCLIELEFLRVRPLTQL